MQRTVSLPRSRPAPGLLQRLGLGFGVAGAGIADAGIANTGPAETGPAPIAAMALAGSIRLFRVVTIRGDLILGLRPAELAALGAGPDLDRLVRRLAEEGQISGWLYRPARGANGEALLRATARVTVPGEDALLLQPHPGGPRVQPPPG